MSSGDDAGDGGKTTGQEAMGDTAVATRSQRMAAVSPTPAPRPDAQDPGDERDTDLDTLIGSVLAGRYEITAKIGQGGMGAVYEATHKLIGKRVAVKVLLDKYSTKDKIVARLEQEARLASSIGHEHIIDITDFGQTHDGRTFVVMEFLEGESLSELIRREGALDEQRAIRIGQQIASALGAAHDKGVIHRDVKPENVFLLQRKDKDFAKVVDFGISKSLRPTADGEDTTEAQRLTQTGMVLGTPLYMSPEQARGDDELDHRIDIYALGVILYEMVTGRVPFEGSNYLSIISQVINDDPPPPRDLRPDLSIELEAVIMKAMAKELDERYSTTDELAEDLVALLDDPGRTTARRISARRYRRKRRRGSLGALVWAAGTAVIVAAVAVTVSVTMGDGDESTEEAASAAVVPEADAAVAAGPAIDAAPARPPVQVVEIDIVSNPPGATIYQEGRRLGEAPKTIRAAKVNEWIPLIAVLDGYDDTEFRINPLVDGGGEAVVDLKKPARGAAPRKIKRPKVRPGSKPKVTVEPKNGKPERDDTAGGELGGNPYD